MTKVVNIYKEKYDVYIGRKGKDSDGYFGNPYDLKTHTREESIAKFKKYFIERLAQDEEFKKKVLDLKDKTLGCFCKPKECHGDIIKEWLDTYD